MSLLVVGSIALDSITTPFGRRSDVLGGAASFFSIAASNFTELLLVGVVGRDFPDAHVELLRSRSIDLEGLERVADGLTFRWSGSYEGRMENALTLDTQLNVLGSFRPTLPESYRPCRYAFLANTDPDTQIHVRDQLDGARFVMLDTMNFWIDGKRESLVAAMKKVDGVIMNDEEARALGDSSNLIRAMQNIARIGVRTLVVKKGEHGSVIMRDGQLFALPAYPLEEVKDPTGAGDTFAAGFLGYLAETDDLTFANMKRALAYGTVVASYTVEEFGIEGILKADRPSLDRRFEAFLSFTRF